MLGCFVGTPQISIDTDTVAEFEEQPPLTIDFWNQVLLATRGATELIRRQEAAGRALIIRHVTFQH